MLFLKLLIGILYLLCLVDLILLFLFKFSLGSGLLLLKCLLLFGLLLEHFFAAGLVGFTTCESSFRFDLDFLGGLECSKSCGGIVVLELIKFLKSHPMFILFFFRQFLLFGNVTRNCILPDTLVVLLLFFILFFCFCVLEVFYSSSNIATFSNNLRECEHVVIAGSTNTIGSNNTVISHGCSKPKKRMVSVVHSSSIDCSHQEQTNNRLCRD